MRQIRTTQRQPGLLFARPVPRGGRHPSTAGLHPLGLDDRRDGFVYVPTTYRPGVAAPLSVKLHGAGGHSRAGMSPFLVGAEANGLLLLGIDSRGPTWDLIHGGYGPDVAFLDAALDHVFARYSVDLRRVSIEGFSDGASYGLSLGVANGELFSKIVAFSPGFLAPGRMQGRPAIFVSHGVHDRVLPIDRCSRRLVPELQVAGYSVEYREFDGGHTVPEAIAAEAEAWVAS